MFDIAWSELLVIGIVAIIVVGPKDLPRLMRTFGHYAGKLRRMAADFQRQFEDAMREAELEEVRKAMQSVRDAAPAFDLSAPIDRPVMLPKSEPQTASASTTPAAPATAPETARVARKASTKSKAASRSKQSKGKAKSSAPKALVPKPPAPKALVPKTPASKTSRKEPAPKIAKGKKP